MVVRGGGGGGGGGGAWWQSRVAEMHSTKLVRIDVGMKEEGRREAGGSKSRPGRVVGASPHLV